MKEWVISYVVVFCLIAKSSHNNVTLVALCDHGTVVGTKLV